MSRILVFILVLCGFFLSSWLSSGSIGAQSACTNSQCVVAAGSSVASIAIALTLVAFLFLYKQKRSDPDETLQVGIWRRFGAFILDFAAVMLIVAPIGAVPLLLAEYHYTGEFRWSFDRDFDRSTDTLLILPAVAGAFLSLYLYFYLHPRLDRPTFGQYVLGYRVTTAIETSRSSYGARVLLSFVGLCVWPVSVVMALRAPHKTFWWDSATNTRAVRVGS